MAPSSEVPPHAPKKSTSTKGGSRGTDTEPGSGREPKPSNWGLDKLKDLVQSAKGLASLDVVEFIRQNLKGVKLIFVFGRTGTGKTQLLKEITGMDLKSGHGLTSGTRHYEVCPAVVGEEKYLFVDTRGFGAADMKDMNSMRDVLSCLFTLGPFITVAGVLFVYSCREERLTSEEATTLRWLRCFCGPRFYQNITVVVTKWDGLSAKETRRARQRLEAHMVDTTVTHGDMAQILHPLRGFPGGQVYHHGIPLDEDGSWGEALDHDDDIVERGALAKAMIQDRYRHAPSIQLQVLLEQSHGIAMEDTESAKVLRSDLSVTKVCTSGPLDLLLNMDEPAPAHPDNDNDGIFRRFLHHASPGNEIPIPISAPFKWLGSHDALSWIDWINVGKNVAMFFWSMSKEWQRLGQPNPGAPGRLWSRVQDLKDWWAGKEPPQS